MVRIEDTGGNVTYIIPYCDCGLTGGCSKCQPIHALELSDVECDCPIFPDADEGRIIDDRLLAFYKKKGYIK